MFPQSVLRRIDNVWSVVRPILGTIAVFVGFVAAIGTLVGIIPPVLDQAIWPRITNTVLWFLVFGQGCDWIGESLEDELDED